MRVSIELSEATNGKFSEVRLCYTNEDSVASEVPLMFNNFVKIFDFKNDLKSKEFDFFIISSLVYGIDNLINRDIYSNEGWARDLEVDFPVYNLSVWQGNEGLLEQVLNFLTGDYWSISFSQNQIVDMFKPKFGRWTKKINIYEKEKIKAVSLFSGGLDSLIGIVNELDKLTEDEKILLVSHFDFKSAGPNRDQIKLYSYLNDKYSDKIYWIQSKVALSRRDKNSLKIDVETNYRSRSLFFLGLGCYLTPLEKLIVPENGTISINYPLTPSRVSSLSTRTTHPFVLNNVNKLLVNCGINVEVENPFKFDTKGEMYIDSNQGILDDIYEKSVSCGKRGRKQHWMNKTGTEHCGTCMPCIYRRAALNKAGLDTQLYGNDITQANKINDFVDMPALFSYLNRNISLEKMKRDLLVNGSINFNQLTTYSHMVLRSKEEVLQLFKDKGNDFVKEKLNI